MILEFFGDANYINDKCQMAEIVVYRLEKNRTVRLLRFCPAGTERINGPSARLFISDDGEKTLGIIKRKSP